MVVNCWPGNVPRLCASDVVAEGTCGRNATLKWRCQSWMGYASTASSTKMDQIGMRGRQSSAGSVRHWVHQIAQTPPMSGSQEPSKMENSL